MHIWYTTISKWGYKKFHLSSLINGIVDFMDNLWPIVSYLPLSEELVCDSGRLE